MGLFDFLKKRNKKAEESLTIEQRVDNLWQDWIRGKTTQPLTDIMTFLSNLGACGHADFFEICEKDEKLALVANKVLPMLPSVINNNYQTAKKIYLVTPKEKRDEDFLNEYDDFFYDQEELVNDFLLSFLSDK